MQIPTLIVIGDSVSWTDSQVLDLLGEVVDPMAWTLTYALRGPTSLDVVGVASFDFWTLTIASTDTLLFQAGQYFYQAYIENLLGIRQTVGSGSVDVIANLSTQAAPFDGRSQTEKDLAAVQASIRNMIAGGAAIEYTIGQRHLRRMQITDLLALESKLKYQLSVEKKAQSIANGLGNPHSLFVRFR